MNILERVLPDFMKPYSGRILLTLLGLITAILFLTIGFWRTLLIIILIGIGYLAGKWLDGGLNIEEIPLLNRLK